MAKAAAAKANPELLQRKDAAPTGALCKVYDMGAKEAKRTHVIEGKKYELSAYEDAPCLVPMHHAVFFLKDKQFAVYTMDGHKMQPQVPISDGRGTKLQRNECIATYAELTKEALVRRAQGLPNGLTININTPRDTIIGFIMAGGKAHQVVEDTDKTVGAKSERVEIEADEDGDEDWTSRALNQEAPGTRGMETDADLGGGA